MKIKTVLNLTYWLLILLLRSSASANDNKIKKQEKKQVSIYLVIKNVAIARHSTRISLVFKLPSASNYFCDYLILSLKKNILFTHIQQFVKSMCLNRTILYSGYYIYVYDRNYPSVWAASIESTK